MKIFIGILAAIGAIDLCAVVVFVLWLFHEWRRKMAEESRYQTKVEKFLRDQGCWYLKYWGGGQYTKTGIPDLLCCVGGYFVAVELKATHGRPSDVQLTKLRDIEKAGGIAMLLYPEDWELFQDIVLNLKDTAGVDPEMLDELHPIHRWHEEIKKRGILC